MTRVARILVAVAFGLLLGFGSVEIGLRLAGHTPARSFDLGSRQPAMYMPDAALGWRPKPGTYRFPAYATGAPDTTVTVRADGTRSSGAAAAGASEVALLGCSFTFGAGIGDEETYVAQLQGRIPKARLWNFGRSGYSTYQSLLLMEQLVAQPDPPRLFLYGYVELHDARNVADPGWLRALDLMARSGIAATPYATLDAGGQLVRHPPIHYPRWPLRDTLATVAFLEQRFTDADGAARAAQARAVTEQLMLAMDRLARSRGVAFAVLLLNASDETKAHYATFLADHDVDVIDCAIALHPLLLVPGEGHPNGRANQKWASCLVEPVWRRVDERF